MKVLYITNIPSPYRVDFFNELGKRCELTVLFEKQGHKSRDKSWLEFQFVNFKGIFLRGIELGEYEKICIDVFKYLKKNYYDFIIVTNMSTITGVLAIHWMKMNHISYCIEGDGGFAGSGIGFKEFLKKSMISAAEICFSTSKMHDEYYYMYGSKKDRIWRYQFSSLYNNEILDEPLNFEEKKAIKTKLGIKEKKMILSVGAFIPRKGMDLLIKATSGIDSDWGIYIVGGTPTREYEDLRKEYHTENLHFVEFLKPEKLKYYFRAADLFVLATREDIWGLVINEAMANALPVITTDKCIAGLELVYDGENGYVVKNENIVDLREKIQKFVKEDELLQKFGQNSLKIIRNYTIEKMVECHVDIFEQKNKCC